MKGSTREIGEESSERILTIFREGSSPKILNESSLEEPLGTTLKNRKTLEGVNRES